MDKATKIKTVSKMTDIFATSSSVVLFACTGVTVGRIDAFRKAIGSVDAGCMMVKNTLGALALANSDYQYFNEFLTGQNMIAYTKGDPIAMIKVVGDFIKDVKDLGGSVRVGLLVGGIGSDVLDVMKLEKFAALPSTDEIRAQIIAALQSPLRSLVSLVNGPAKGVLAVIAQAAKEGEGTA